MQESSDSLWSQVLHLSVAAHSQRIHQIAACIANDNDAHKSPLHWTLRLPVVRGLVLPAMTTPERIMSIPHQCTGETGSCSANTPINAIRTYESDVIGRTYVRSAQL